MEGAAMSYVRLLGYSTLSCGCVVGRYRETATGREVTYVEQKGATCGCHQHRRNRRMRPATLSASSARGGEATAF
jgi:hypothetical protein